MSVQELLTYVEELEFKTSMFGYDKDEVDIQLDKICDEIESIVKDKDSEIEALKNDRPILVQTSSEDVIKTEEEAVEPEVKKGSAEESEAVVVAPEESAAIVLEEQIEELRQRLKEAEAQEATLLQQVKEAEERAAKAEEKAAKAEEKAAQAEGRASAAEAKLAAVGPQTKEEAYEQYIHNADLLCQQITELQDKEDSVLKEAEENAGKIVNEAKAEADRIMLEVLGRRGEEEDKIEELRRQRGKAAESLAAISDDVQTVLKKMQDSQEV